VHEQYASLFKGKVLLVSNSSNFTAFIVNLRKSSFLPFLSVWGHIRMHNALTDKRQDANSLSKII